MEFFHVLNRGVDKRRVFSDVKDYVRFLHDCYVFNDKTHVDSNHRFKSFGIKDKREPLVAIHAWCLMPNHYHMLVSEAEEGGLSLFMQKLNMGYAKYFNERQNRSGVLWQGTFRKIHIKHDAHFMYIPHYIHLNPLDLSMPQWRIGRVQNINKALKYMREYRWSSFMDYNGIKNMPSLITKTSMGDILGSPKNQEREIKRIIASPELLQASASIE